MKLYMTLLAFVVLTLVCGAAYASQAKELDKAEQNLLGEHMFSLQWISWDKFGTATVTRKSDGGLYVNARQELDSDYAALKGDVRVIDTKEFTVTGELVTCVSHINGGKPCVRDGTFTFKTKGGRKYWRIQEMDNPCDELVDYVDIYFKLK